MRIGDKEWRSKVAKLLCDMRRVIDHKFARVVAKSARETRLARFGEEIAN